MEFAAYFSPAATATNTAPVRDRKTTRQCLRVDSGCAIAVEILIRPI